MIRCAQCRESAPPGARFCPFCGVHLPPAAHAVTRSLPRGAAAPGDGVAVDHLASRAELPGERKHVTVLFADVSASMAVLARHDAEEAEALFDRVIEFMVEAVRRYEGTVTQVLGDGIMALFGAPLAHEDHAVRACYAALRMQERISAYGDDAQRTYGIPILIRVGLNSGEVVLRALGADSALSAVGQTVHVASRMEQLAKPGTTLATRDTADLGGRRVRTRPLGTVNVKGLADPMEVFEIVGAARSGVRAESPSPAASPLVGREGELARLTAVLDRVCEGAGLLVALSGEPGIGKTRLVREFLRVCRARGCVAFGSAGQPYTRATGHRVGLDIIRSYFGLDPSEAPAAIREKVGSTMRALDPELAEQVPAMVWQLGVLEASNPLWRLDAATRRQRGFEANFRLIAAEARRQPFVLLLENLQWVDSGAEDSIRIFAKTLTPFTLALITYRPEYDDRWVQETGATHLHLDPLVPKTAGELLDLLLGAEPSLAPVKRLLVERAGGNPFFLEESIRELVQSGALVGERGDYRLDHPVTAIHVPSTVRSVLEARMDRLSPEDKRVLQCAAVIGEHVPTGLLEAVTERLGEETRAALARLRQAEFLEEEALFPEPVYAFRHSLTHDVAYGSLLLERRRALHARVLAALEQLPADASDGITEALAYHAAHAELWEPAVRYARAAGLKTDAGRGHREAVALFEQALAALEHLADDAAHRALGVDLRDELARALVPLGENPRMAAMLREAEAMAAALGDDARRARTLALLCTAYWEVGDSANAMETGERAVALAERAGDPDLQVMANFSLGGATRAIGDYRGAVALLRRNLPLTEGERAAHHFGFAAAASVLTRGHLAWSLAELGEFPEAVQRADEAIRLAQLDGNAFGQTHAHLALGGTLLRQGRLAEAMPVLERGLGLAKDAPFLYAPTAGDLGVVYAMSGRPAAGIELAERAVAQAERMGRLGRLALIVTHLGDSYLFAGRLEEAALQAQRALRLAGERGERGNQVYAHRLAGLIAAEEDPPRVEVARQHLGQALALAETLRARALVARCHLGLGHLERRLGEADAAGRHLDIAGRMLESMRMKYW
ncbi:MAG TPA: adenylate/guanylate cyclase domain-containing protein, partial [Candidatus Methylomirabilis sp.]|nr:adenylate/guanylate cyclase domain-containing protein [Candidatus Methylomirabilis sp.]